MRQRLCVRVWNRSDPVDSDTLNDRQYSVALGVSAACGMLVTAVTADMARLSMPIKGVSAISAWTFTSLMLLMALAWVQGRISMRFGRHVSVVLKLVVLSVMALVAGSQQGTGLRYYNSALGLKTAPMAAINLAYICGLAVIVICFICFMNVLWTGNSGSTIGAFLLTEAFVAANMCITRWTEEDGSWLDTGLGLLLVVWFDISLYCANDPVKPAVQKNGRTAVDVASRPFIWIAETIWALIYWPIRILHAAATKGSRKLLRST